MSRLRASVLATLLVYFAAIECSRGDWRRFVRSKGPRAAAIGRRAFHREDGVVFLLPPYGQADTKTRATLAAWVDSRPVVNGGSGVHAWDFVENVTVAEALAPPGVSMGDLTQTTVFTGATITDDIADPAGGMNAQTCGDDTAGVGVCDSDDVGDYVFQEDLVVTGWVKREVGASQWGTVELRIAGAVRVSMAIDLDTGRIEARTGVGINTFAQAFNIAGVDWFFISYRFAGLGTGLTDVGVRIIPAFGSDFLVIDGAATGNMTVFDLRVVQESVSGVLVSPAPWAFDDEMRIFSDGSIFIEGARENLCTESANASAWTTAGITTEVSGKIAPDGSPSAWLIGDADAGVAASFTQAFDDAVVGTHVYSVRIRKDSDTSRFPEFQIVEGTAVITGGSVRVQVNTSTGATDIRTGTPTSVAVISEGDFWRLEIVMAVTTGGTWNGNIYPAVTTVFGIIEVAAQGTVTTWNVQIGKGAFTGSPIRTTGAAATRNIDVVQYVVTAVQSAAFQRDGGWFVDVWPTWSSTDTHDDPLNAYLFEMAPGNALLLRRIGQTGGQWGLIVGGGAAITSTVAHVAGDRIRLHVTSVVGGATSLRVENVTQQTTGSTATGTGGATAMEGTTLTVGGSSGGVLRFFHGVISRPVAA